VTAMPEPEMMKHLQRVARQTDGQIAAQRTRTAADHRDYDAWKVTVPVYDNNGVKIERFEVTPQEAVTSQLRAAFNPQRGDRSVLPGEYTRLLVDDTIWMSDTPAEIRDLDSIDHWMHVCREGSMLIVGLGLGMILHRAIVTHNMRQIDVVEADWRVVSAVNDHYQALAKEHGTALAIWNDDIHKLRLASTLYWDLGFFDIWAHIDHEDLPEVTRLRRRFASRLGHFEAWAQKERIAQKRRIASGKWAY